MPFIRACSEIGLAFGQRSVGLSEVDSPQNDTMLHTHGIVALGWKWMLPLPREVPTQITHHPAKSPNRISQGPSSPLLLANLSIQRNLCS